MRTTSRLLLAPLVAGIALAGLSTAPAGADHSWGNYHWARTANPFTVKLADNVSGAWDGVLATTSSDWSDSSVLDTTIVAGNLAGARKCRPSAGRVEVCNASFGRNGWLGLASIWASGSHITQATVKLNDSYFANPPYNTTAWRNLVSCQEVGHAFGLDHQDEAFDNPNLGTCMDYTNNPASNQHPNQHDYDQLEAIYAHLDSTSTLSATAGPSGAAAGYSQAEWGRAIRTDGAGRPIMFEKDLAGGGKLFTFVVWAE